MIPHPTPRTEYEQRLEARRRTAAEQRAREARLANLRLVAFLIALGVLGTALGTRSFSVAWTVVPLIGFGALMILHDRAIQARALAERAVRYYEQGLARLEERWAGQGNAGEAHRDPEHPYAEDLDLFGRGSLFELLCTAQTRSGEETLAAWLKQGASIEEVRERQEAVRELQDRLDLRERAALLGQDVRRNLEVEAVVRWGEAPVKRVGAWVPYAGYAQAAATMAAVAAWMMGYGLLPLGVMVGLELAFLGLVFPGATQVLHGVEEPARQLGQLGRLLACLEEEEWTSPRLRSIRAGLQVRGEPPSRRLARLDTLFGLAQAMHNGVFAIVGFLLLWPLQIAIRIEQWRAESGEHLEDWMRLTGDWEALSSLAGYAYEHPEDIFPALSEGGPLFRAEGLTHPLLPAGAAVRNDVRLDAGQRLLLVSGSNMSGKSTLLRAVGTNTVLALAGAPVRARALTVSALQVGASIRTQDSLQGGISRFYAEILRLRALVEMAGTEPPLLFLLDEILHGTNSHDRRIGAEGVIRTLLQRGAVGLVTTHDLALARIAGDGSVPGLNVHFQDDIIDGRMHFDYHLRPGVVEKSNALELMRAVGLDVGDQEVRGPGGREPGGRDQGGRGPGGR